MSTATAPWKRPTPGAAPPIPRIAPAAFVVVVEPAAGTAPDEALRRLRGWLKTGLRCYRLRCRSVLPAAPPTGRSEK